MEIRVPGREIVRTPTHVKKKKILLMKVCITIRVNEYLLAPHLTGLRTVRIKLDLLGSQLSPSIYIITQVNLTKRALAQKLPSAPRHRSTGR